jgi:hypothetical protein
MEIKAILLINYQKNSLSHAYALYTLDDKLYEHDLDISHGVIDIRVFLRLMHRSATHIQRFEDIKPMGKVAMKNHLDLILPMLRNNKIDNLWK